MKNDDEKLQSVLIHYFDMTSTEVKKFRDYGEGSFALAIRKSIKHLDLLPKHNYSEILPRDEALNFILNGNSREEAKTLWSIYSESCTRNGKRRIGKIKYYALLESLGVSRLILGGNKNYFETSSSVKALWEEKYLDGEIEFTFDVHNYDEEIH